MEKEIQEEKGMKGVSKAEMERGCGREEHREKNGKISLSRKKRRKEEEEKKKSERGREKDGEGDE